MERLTDAHGICYMASTEYCVDMRDCYICKYGKNAFKTLTAYEDTNLTPSDIADLRNELCFKCGRYKTAHEGACDGCRWKKGEII